MEVPLVRGVIPAAAAALLLGPSLVAAQEKPKEEQEIIPGIPLSAMPPEGMCRVWLKDVPERSQPAATDCATAIKSRPRDAMLLLGEPSKNAKLPTQRRTSISNRMPIEDPIGMGRGFNSINPVDRSASLQRQQAATSGTPTATRPTPTPAPVPVQAQGAVKAVEQPTKAAVQVKPPPQ
jgi:hypothetical protein